MKRLLFSLSVMLLLATCATAQNGVNPLQAHYASGTDFPAWSSEFNWTNTINMATYTNGATNFEKFENARDALYAQGGGVLYYPAGTYTFDVPRGPNGRGLMLKKGVVIVGDAPTADKNAVRTLNYDSMATHGLGNMPTKFVFTDSTLVTGIGTTGKIPFMWNMIGVKKGANETSVDQISHFGVIWIEIEMGYIYFGFGSDVAYAPTYNQSGCWLKDVYKNGVLKTKVSVNGWGDRVPDGTHPMDAFAGCSVQGSAKALLAQKIIVFGVKMTNALCPNYAIDKAGTIGTGFLENNNWRFGAKLGVYGRHLFVANNVIDKPTASFVTAVKAKPDSKTAPEKITNFNDTAGTLRLVLFDYGYGISMDINKGHASLMFNRCAYDDTNSLFYAEDVVVKDNWTYNHGNKSLECSGKFLVVKGNVFYRDYHQHNYGPTKPFPYPNLNNGSNLIQRYVNYSNGRVSYSETVDDNMSRAMDMAGANSWIHGNNYGTTGSTTANDGEGILFQRHNGVEVFSVAQTHNYKNPANGGGSGYIAPYDIHVVGLVQLQNVNEAFGATGYNKPEANRVEDMTSLYNFNDRARTNLSSPAGVGGSGNQMDYMVADPGIVPTAPTVTVVSNQIKKYVEITWADSSAYEFGYQVERKCGTEVNYKTIAIRPRQETPGTWTYPVITSNYGPTPHGCGNLTADFNPPVWRDYLYGNQTGCTYQVVALDSAKTWAPFPVLRASEPTPMGSLNIYPNPSNGLINIRLMDVRNTEIEISLTDLSGRTVLTHRASHMGNDIQVPTSNIAKGQYIVRVQAGNQILIDKILVE